MPTIANSIGKWLHIPECSANEADWGGGVEK
jgi:hypothetical protein